MDSTPLLTLRDLLDTQSGLLQKEEEDRKTLLALSSLSLDKLRDTLLTWVSLQMPPMWTFYELSIVPPTTCSDGVSRGLADYIQFCSGRDFPSYIVDLQAKVGGVVFGYQSNGGRLRIVVSKADTP